MPIHAMCKCHENLGSKAHMSLREKAFVVLMCATLCALTSNYAILATFFPIEMTARGMSKYNISLIFVAFDFGKLATGFFAGALASYCGRLPVLFTGILLSSAFGCFIGFIPQLVDHHLHSMFVLFTVARALQGSGVALAQQSIYAILGDSFPDNRGLVMGAATAMVAWGYFIGPPIGGALYGASGFRLPFVFNGLVVVAFVLPIISLQPPVKPAPSEVFTSPTRGLLPEGAFSPGGRELGCDNEDPPPPAAAAAAAPAAVAAAPPSAADALPRRGATVRQYLRVLRMLPVDVWIAALLPLMVYFSKWGWWDSKRRLIASVIDCECECECHT